MGSHHRNPKDGEEWGQGRPWTGGEGTFSTIMKGKEEKRV